MRPKYACRTCIDGFTQAPMPPSLIEGGLPTEGAFAHVLVTKYTDHLPLYRQSQILSRSRIDIHRSTLADWVGVAAFHLRPVVNHEAVHRRNDGAGAGPWPPGKITDFVLMTEEGPILEVVAVDVRELAFGSGIPVGIDWMIPTERHWKQRSSQAPIHEAV